MVYGPVLDETVPRKWIGTVVDNDGAICTMPMKQSGSGAVHRPVRRPVSTTSQYVGTASGNYPRIGTILATVGGETVGLSIVIGAGEVSVTGSEATMIDVVAALRISASGGYNEDADLNDDGKVTSLDALMILQVVVG